MTVIHYLVMYGNEKSDKFMVAHTHTYMPSSMQVSLCVLCTKGTGIQVGAKSEPKIQIKQQRDIKIIHDNVIKQHNRPYKDGE